MNWLIKAWLFIAIILASFLLGLFIAGWVDAGKGQGLAGGAIVLSYGVVGAIIGLLLSVFIVRLRMKSLKMISAVATLLLVCLIIAIGLKSRKNISKVDSSLDKPKVSKSLAE